MVAGLPLETVTLQAAVLPPSAVVTVMVASPTALPVTLPLLSTVATPVLEDFQVTFLLAALEGDTVAVSWVAPLTFTVAEVLFSDTPVTATVAAVTVTEQVADTPLAAVAVILAVPAFKPVTTPEAFTVAMSDAEVVQVNVVTVASEGSKLTLLPRSSVFPVATESAEGRTTLLTGMGLGVSSSTLTSQVSL